MAEKTTLVVTVDQELKEQAEEILAELGISMSSAISLFLRQVVIERGIPFPLKLPRSESIDISTLTGEDPNAEIQKGSNDAKAGRVCSSAETMAIRCPVQIDEHLIITPEVTDKGVLLPADWDDPEDVIYDDFA